VSDTRTSQRARRPSHHPIFARAYGRMAAAGEEAGRAGHRAEMLAGLSGKVIEVGAGTGLNFPHYPSAVTVILAVEPEPHLRRLAAQATTHVSVPVRIAGGTAGLLPADEAEFDAGVCSGVLCTVPDQRQALTELHRVIRPGGQLRFYEHVRSTDPRQARFQDRADRIWAALNGGCHTNRDTEAAITAAGFHIQACRRFDFRPCLLAAPVAPHILGRATRE
jgi:ubiquinone/menaquinone biosynthesis C-methylase UbiE